MNPRDHALPIVEALCFLKTKGKTDPAYALFKKTARKMYDRAQKERYERPSSIS